MTQDKPLIEQTQAVDPKLLQEAFEQFMVTSRVMEKAYHELQGKVDELNLELEEKNRQLSDQLEATERARIQLADVLASLTPAVAVFGGDGKLMRLNRAGEQLFDMTEGEAVGGDLPALFERRFAALPGCESLFAATDLLPETEIGALDAAGGRVLRVSTHRMGGMEAGEGRILLAEDITDQVQRRQAAERNQRLAAMGELAVQIVHQIRNPMGSIELFASLLQRDLVEQPESAELAAKIQQGIKSLNLVIGNLLSFAKGAEPVPEPTDFADLCERALQDMAPLLAANGVVVEKELAVEANYVHVDRELWRQVMLNLMINAVQAMPAGGVLSLRAQRTDGADGPPTTRIVVADTGEGIAPEVRDRVFHPFFSTKERGTGLGLALVHNIVKAHHGQIEVESNVGHGSTFTITLPG